MTFEEAFKGVKEKMANKTKQDKESIIPIAGLPCTYVIGSDRYAYRIITVSRSRHEVQAVQIREYKDNHYIIPEKFTLRKDGYYHKVGRSSGFLKLGYAENYRDPDF